MTKILIVDDDTDITLAFKKGLENDGFKVDVFNDPLEALSNFEASKYDLLLLDIRMPKMNGFELYKEMDKIDNNVKVCFITAFEVYYEALREVFPSMEVECFIRKPIEIGNLVKRIKNELNLSNS
ncbi:MAG TPA: response regulator [Candidatus Bathyarchaeia archaeon]|nr:response regulator [Candidatus Bathyarchaeia archaeon]